MSDLEGRVCVVTGGTGAIGRATSEALAARGATVVLVCRDPVRGEEAAAAIRAASGNRNVGCGIGDLADMDSVRRVADSIAETHDRIHVLVNAAAVFVRRRALTRDGLESMFATNHLGPFLLTNLLLERLKTAASSRILTVSAPSTVKLEFDNLQGERTFRALRAFGATKTANLLFTYELARRLEGTRVSANALHPGVTHSGLMREAPAVIRLLVSPFAKPPERAAQAIAHLVTSPDLEGQTGRFFRGIRPSESSPYSRDRQVAERLWEVSERLTGLSE